MSHGTAVATATAFATAVATAVLGWPTTAHAQAGPHLELDPAEVPPGATVQITGSCGPAAAGQSVQVVATGELSGQLARVETASGSGDLRATATIPTRSPEGRGTVVAACGLGQGDPRAELAVTSDGTSTASTLRRGDQGRLVAWWQDRLNEWLALTGSDLHPIAVDGIFGPRTEAATLEFQHADDRVEPNAAIEPVDRVALEEALDRLEGPPDTVAPIGELATEPRQSAAFPALGEIAQLTDIRTGVHDGFERIVFDLTDGDVEHRVRYVDRPPVSIPGDPVTVHGAAMLEIRLSGASGVDLRGPEPVMTYDGPHRFAPAGHEVIREVARIDDFEGNTSWLVGVDRVAPFAVAVLEAPLRLVVDIART
jgi:hypothetical protein